MESGYLKAMIIIFIVMIFIMYLEKIGHQEYMYTIQQDANLILIIFMTIIVVCQRIDVMLMQPITGGVVRVAQVVLVLVMVIRLRRIMKPRLIMNLGWNILEVSN